MTVTGIVNELMMFVEPGPVFPVIKLHFVQIKCSLRVLKAHNSDTIRHIVNMQVKSQRLEGRCIFP